MNTTTPEENDVPTLTDDELDTTIAAAWTASEKASAAFDKAITRAERLCLLRLGRLAPQEASHLVMDWSGESWTPQCWASNGQDLSEIDEDTLDLGPNPSDTMSWRDLIDPTMPNNSCTKHLDLSVLRAIEKEL